MNKSRVEPGQAALMRDDQLRCERVAINLCVDAQTVDPDVLEPDQLRAGCPRAFALRS